MHPTKKSIKYEILKEIGWNMIKLQPVLASNKIIIKLICRISLLKREHLEVLSKIQKITMT